MSHTAVLLSSERCGHCRNMRGSGRLLSKNEIKKENKQPNIPGGYHYDAKFMKKLITAGMDGSAKLKVINVHYRTFNAAEGVMDLSVFTLEEDGNTVRQTMLTEKDGKTTMSIYSIGETGKVVSTQKIDTDWTEICKTYTPVNLSSYAFFFPSLILFEGSAWAEGIKNQTPIYGYLNGLETKTEPPYGFNYKKDEQPNVLEFPNFLQQFFNGTRKLLGKPETNSGTVETPSVPTKEPEPETIKVPAAGAVAKKTSSENMVVPSAGAKNRLKYRLYVVEK